MRRSAVPTLRRATLVRFGLRALFVSRYLTSTVPAQLLLLLLGMVRLRLPGRMLAYIAVSALYVGVVLVQNPQYAPMSNFIFYFSFVPPFLVMMSTRSEGSQEFLDLRAMKVVLVLTALDAVAMSTGLRQYMWFFPEGHSHGQSMIFGFYNRPSGVAAVASSSGALAVFMLVLSDLWHRRETLLNRRLVITLLTLLLLQSGTGFAMFGAYVVLRLVQQYRSRLRVRNRSAGLLILASVVGAIYTTRNLEFEQAAQFRFSLEYARQVYEVKVAQLELTRFGRPATLWLGAQIDPALVGQVTTSDFGVLGMVQGIGIVGTTLILLPPLLFRTGRRSLVLPTVFFYACFLHYPALSSPPGAVIYGAFLWTLWSVKRGTL